MRFDDFAIEVLSSHRGRSMLSEILILVVSVGSLLEKLLFCSASEKQTCNFIIKIRRSFINNCFALFAGKV